MQYAVYGERDELWNGQNIENIFEALRIRVRVRLGYGLRYKLGYGLR